MKTALILTVSAVAAAQLSAATVDWSKLPPAATTEGVTFAKDIQPLFTESCVRCHGAERPRAQLRLDSLEGVMKGTKDGPVVNPGDSTNSLLVQAISQLDPKTAMPPKPRARRGPQGTNAPAMPPRDGAPMAGGPEAGGPPPGGPAPRNAGPPPKPLTAEQVGLVRAWIDQGAK